jgi:hypothetical protein
VSDNTEPQKEMILKNNSNSIKLKEKIVSFFKRLVGKEPIDEKISKMLNEMREEHPELSSEDIRDEVRAFHEIKNIERQKYYNIVLIALTLTNIYFAYQSFQIQKSHFVSVIGQSCPDVSYGYVQHSFSFVNIGKSSGAISVGYRNNESSIVSFSYASVENNQNYNPIGLVLKDGESSTYNMLVTPIGNKNFSFTMYAQTDDGCIERTCSYAISVNNPNRFEKIENDVWKNCIP